LLDQIHIRDLRVNGVIGVNPSERDVLQEVLVNLTIFTDITPAAASDDIADAVNYRTVTKAVIAHIQIEAPRLVERLATDLTRVLFDLDQRIQAIELTVEKPGAVTHTRSVGVTIRRERNQSA